MYRIYRRQDTTSKCTSPINSASVINESLRTPLSPPARLLSSTIIITRRGRDLLLPFYAFDAPLTLRRAIIAAGSHDLMHSRLAPSGILETFIIPLRFHLRGFDSHTLVGRFPFASTCEFAVCEDMKRIAIFKIRIVIKNDISLRRNNAWNSFMVPRKRLVAASAADHMFRYIVVRKMKMTV